MKGDKFRKMAARCGDLPDSVMAVPGLEYVGEKSAEWEALYASASSWCSTPRDLSGGSLIHSTDQFAGLARFARLMAIVTREQT